MANLVVGVLSLRAAQNLKLVLRHALLLGNRNARLHFLLVAAFSLQLGLVDGLALLVLLDLEVDLVLHSQVVPVRQSRLLTDVARRFGSLLEASKCVLVGRLRSKSRRRHKLYKEWS